MSIWLCKHSNFDASKELDLSDIKKEINVDDKLYIYSDDNETGMFLLEYEFIVNAENKLIPNDSFESKNIDLPYAVLYKTKSEDRIIQLSKKEFEFIFDEQSNILSDKKSLFKKYIENSHLSENSKKATTRINYLDKIVPELINKDNPTSIFSIDDTDILLEIKSKLTAGGELSDINTSTRYAGQILQTMNMYLDFLEDYKVPHIEGDKNNHTIDNNKNASNHFKTFLSKIKPQESSEIKLHEVSSNIQFIIGQPNTGKSYNFEESQIFSGVNKKYYKYKKIPVSGGIGNEYKGLQNTDLAITYDPVKKELKFGEFLQILMSAIVNPGVPHVIFLDDFHNQDISSLLSEYTPLFKAQQKRTVTPVDNEHEIYAESFADTDIFIDTWNKFIIDHCINIPVVPLTNRISGDSLNLVFPDNFYLLGAANFNENTLNIFADWEDRAQITYKDPIETFEFKGELGSEKAFLECCKDLNNKYRDILKSKNIFDTERYCFGMWKVVKSNGSLISDISDQKKVIDFFFGMIKNALKFNNKNSYINEFGWELLKIMQSNDWFKENVEELKSEQIDLSTLHKHNIYEDEI